MKGQKVTTIRLDEDLYQKFKVHCAKKNIFVSDEIIKLIKAEMRL
jgi:hypothetical protein